MSKKPDGENEGENQGSLQNLQEKLKKSIENMLKGAGFDVSNMKIGTPQLHVSYDGGPLQQISPEEYHNLEKYVHDNIKDLLKSLEENPSEIQIALPNIYSLISGDKTQNVPLFFSQPQFSKFDFPNISALPVDNLNQNQPPLEFIEAEIEELLGIIAPKIFGKSAFRYSMPIDQPEEKIVLGKEDLDCLEKVADKNTREALETMIKWREYHSKSKNGIKEVCQNFNKYKSFWTG